jgi:hypothetical protein
MNDMNTKPGLFGGGNQVEGEKRGLWGQMWSKYLHMYENRLMKHVKSYLKWEDNNKEWEKVWLESKYTMCIYETTIINICK